MNDKVTLSNKVRIGGLDFTVTFDRGVSADDGSNELFGQCDVNALALRINPNYPVEHVIVTVIHEILHAILTLSELDRYIASGVDPDGTTYEERLVTLLSREIYGAMYKNPALFEEVRSVLNGFHKEQD